MFTSPRPASLSSSFFCFFGRWLKTKTSHESEVFKNTLCGRTESEKRYLASRERLQKEACDEYKEEEKKSFNEMNKE